MQIREKRIRKQGSKIYAELKENGSKMEPKSERDWKKASKIRYEQKGQTEPPNTSLSVVRGAPGF